MDRGACRLQSSGPQNSGRQLSGQSTKLVCKTFCVQLKLKQSELMPKLMVQIPSHVKTMLPVRTQTAVLRGEQQTPWCSQKSTIIATTTTAHHCCVNSNYPFTEHLCARNHSHQFYTLPQNFTLH